MHWINYIGYIACSLSSITFIPQVYKAWQTKSVKDLSIWMLLLVMISTILWLIYGFGIYSGPVIMGNITVLLLSFVLLFFKLRFTA
jgi:MtN3 and saliva related transmembrane protein